MAWYIDTDANAPVWQKRIAITVNNDGGPVNASADVDTSIPVMWEAFWSVIDANGYNIRVTLADGITDVPYAIDDGAGGTFDATAIAARTGRIRVDGVVVADDCMQLLWLYFDPDAAAADGSVAVTITSALDGFIEIDAPGPRQYIYKPQSPRSSSPADATSKAPGEVVDLWIRVDGAFAKNQYASQNSRYYEEAYALTMSVVDGSGVDQSTLYSAESNRFVWVDRGVGEMWLRIYVKGGTHNTLYTVVPTVVTIDPDSSLSRQALQPRVGLSVFNARYT